MTSFSKTLIVAALMVVPTMAGAQDRTTGNTAGNGIPQQVAALQTQLAQANAAVAALQTLVAALEARLGAESQAREAGDAALHAEINTQVLATQDQGAR